ncbi:MAG: adenylyltransferase [Rhodobacteraceae bacterium]|nr:MAG: adenylyltransferase [Paracoccaceae bacterium]
MLLCEIPELFAQDEKLEYLKEKAPTLKSWHLTVRQACDLDLILNGAFYPLTGFLSKDEYNSVCENMCLTSGDLWPIPINLDVSENFADMIKPGEEIALRDQEGVILAILTVEDIWSPDKALEAENVFGSNNTEHPGVSYLKHKAGSVYVGGSVIGVNKPTFYDFKALRDTPNELRKKFNELGWSRIVAFQTRNPLHRAHYELTHRASEEFQANLLIHPVVGMTKPGDIDHFTRVRCYEAILHQYPRSSTCLSLLNLAMRMAGPREAILHGLIRANYGCTHFIIGRDHAGPGLTSDNKPFYEPYKAQEFFERFQDKININLIKFKNFVYVEDKAQFEAINEVPIGAKTLEISGTELRRRLNNDLPIPEWFSFPDVIRELRRSRPPRNQQGFTVFFTGLSGSGKSTIANALLNMLLEIGDRPVTLLDGDIVRKRLSSELGFSKEHRDLNIRRIGYVAMEIVKNGGIAICAPIAPYEQTRKAVREEIQSFGSFVEVYLSTTLEVCERRDRKGLYKLARLGKIKEFTGISDPYEVPQSPELEIDSENSSVEHCASEIMLKLRSLGLLGARV